MTNIFLMPAHNPERASALISKPNTFHMHQNLDQNMLIPTLECVSFTKYLSFPRILHSTHFFAAGVFEQCH